MDLKDKITDVLNEFLDITKTYPKGIPKHINVEYIYKLKNLIELGDDNISEFSKKPDMEESISYKPKVSLLVYNINTLIDRKNSGETTVGRRSEKKPITEAIEEKENHVTFQSLLEKGIIFRTKDGKYGYNK